jgi:hypothetical protein
MVANATTQVGHVKSEVLKHEERITYCAVHKTDAAIGLFYVTLGVTAACTGQVGGGNASIEAWSSSGQ